MASLTSAMQKFVVEGLARYATPTEMVKAVKERFGVNTSRQQLEYYDPTKGEEPAQKWVDLFWKVRTAVQEGSVDHALKHIGYRVSEYQNMYRWARRVGNKVLALKIMKQAAKDLGGKFTNQHELTGQDGKPMQVESKNANVDVSELEDTDDPEEAMRLFNQLFNA